MSRSALTAPAAGAHPAVSRPRLVTEQTASGVLSLADEHLVGTYGRSRTPDLVAELEEAGLRGRGGAGFPAHQKWRAVAAAPAPRVVVANGEEGEPTSLKDRWLLTHRPHLVLDGMFRAARSVGAERAILYLAHPETVAAVTAALDELERLPDELVVEVHVVEPRYVAGEETAVCRSINGGPALPTSKPPRPFERGVAGRPTLVSNVETLAHASWIARHGAEAYRRYGTDSSPGTTLVTLGGACHRPGVYEVPFGLTLIELFQSVGGGLTAPATAYVMGGWFGGLVSAECHDVSCCYEAVRATGSGLGCAAITVLSEDDDPLSVAAAISAWYAEESAGQCGVCVKGTAAIRDAIASLKRGTADERTRSDLARWGTSLRGRGACALLDGAATLARSAVVPFSARPAEDGSFTEFPTRQGGMQ